MMGKMEKVEVSGLCALAGSTFDVVASTIPVKLPVNAAARCSASAGQESILYMLRKSTARRFLAFVTTGVGRSKMGTGDVYRASSVVSIAFRSALGEVKLRTLFGASPFSVQFVPAWKQEVAKDLNTSSTLSNPSAHVQC
jgi:hypothetical protein